MFLLNGIIVLLAGFVFNWGKCVVYYYFYLLFESGGRHDSYQSPKVTAMIVTTRPEAVALEVLNKSLVA